MRNTLADRDHVSPHHAAMATEIAMAPLEPAEPTAPAIADWLLNGEHNSAAHTLLGALVTDGQSTPFSKIRHGEKGPSYPRDARDFRACLIALTRFPSLRARLGRAEALSNEWGAIVYAWSDIETRFLSEAVVGATRRLAASARIGTLEHWRRQERAWWHPEWLRLGARPAAEAVDGMVKAALAGDDIEEAIRIAEAKAPLFIARRRHELRTTHAQRLERARKRVERIVMEMADASDEISRIRLRNGVQAMQYLAFQAAVAGIEFDWGIKEQALVEVLSRLKIEAAPQPVSVLEAALR